MKHGYSGFGAHDQSWRITIYEIIYFLKLLLSRWSVFWISVSKGLNSANDWYILILFCCSGNKLFYMTWKKTKLKREQIKKKGWREIWEMKRALSWQVWRPKLRSRNLKFMQTCLKQLYKNVGHPEILWLSESVRKLGQGSKWEHWWHLLYPFQDAVTKLKLIFEFS